MRLLDFLVELGVADGNTGHVGDGLLQGKLRLGEEIDLAMDNSQHAHQHFLGHQGHAQRGSCRIDDFLVRPHQPAFVLLGVVDQHRFLVLDHPPCQT